VNTRVVIDPQRFEPWKIQEISHRLADHPLLQIDALVELGRRLESRKLVRTHNSDATAGSSFADAPQLHPNAKGAEATLAGIAEAKAWMSLLNVQADPLYRALVDEVLEELRPHIELRDPGMCYRAGWIFVSSPARHRCDIRGRTGALSRPAFACSGEVGRELSHQGARHRSGTRCWRVHAIHDGAHGRERSAAVCHDELHLLHELNAPSRIALSR